ncbi:MAG: ABC transporter permease [Sorangiineae bacterium NIC37A_2]|jgi:ABC-2 type transport system permease protein|nr:MAG: ABC transporter permease [Sorangiineae bacterium NIC37A_2]
MDAVLSIAKREFRSYFDSPLAYVVICLSFFGLGLLFFNFRGGFWQLDRATMQPLFEYLPAGLAMVVVPVVTMRLMAEERRSGTLEMLITLPVKDSDVILGKYLGALGLVLIVVLGSVTYPLFMFKFPWNLGPLDSGPILSGYVGLLLYAAASVSVGLLVSSLTESQAISFFVTLFLLGAFWFSGSMADQMTGAVANFLHYISFQTRMSGFMRGLIDTRDVVFFLSITALCLVISFRALERRKWA